MALFPAASTLISLPALAIVACMRKQLTVLNTMMKNGTHWDEKLA
jgi:hypothetical protein